MYYLAKRVYEDGMALSKEDPRRAYWAGYLGGVMDVLLNLGVDRKLTEAVREMWEKVNP